MMRAVRFMGDSAVNDNRFHCVIVQATNSKQWLSKAYGRFTKSCRVTHTAMTNTHRDRGWTRRGGVEVRLSKPPWRDYNGHQRPPISQSSYLQILCLNVISTSRVLNAMPKKWQPTCERHLVNENEMTVALKFIKWVESAGVRIIIIQK